MRRIPVIHGFARVCRIVRVMTTRHLRRLIRWGHRGVDDGADLASDGPVPDRLVVLPEPLSVAGSCPAIVEPERPRSPKVVADNPVVEPPFLGVRVVSPVWVDEIVGYVNEDELLGTGWGMLPADDENERDWLRRCRGVFDRRLGMVRSQELLVPQVAYGFFPVNSDGRELIVWADDDRIEEQLRLVFPRQRHAPYLCVADYFKPVGSADYAALQMVTLGTRISTRLVHLYPGEPQVERAALRALAGSLTEALTEYWHRRIRIEWGFDDEDGPTLRLVFGGMYRGQRFPVGAGNNEAVSDLLDAGRVGVSVRSDDALVPEYAAASLIAHHPQAEGFAV
jgi:5-methyltetrahydrofolate--homocysteine methyltransferase